MPNLAPKNTPINARQTALFAAFVLPIYKVLELPSLLSRFTAGDLLIPAFLGFLLQGGTLCAILCAMSQSDKTLQERLEERLGKWAKLLYGVYAAAFFFFAALPLLDLEKFVYAIFYDTAPTLFAFAFFFVFSAFFCVKRVKALGRIGDLSVFLFPVSLLTLIVMSLTEADVTNLLPLFEQRFSSTLAALRYTTPHFADVFLLLPLLCNVRFQKGDGVKIGVGYGVGALFTLLFLAVFYGVFSTIAFREHYAFAKIAQYFPVLAVVGRIDLIFVYLLCVVLFFFTATPLLHAVEYTAKACSFQKRTLLSFIFNLSALLFVLFFNRHYNVVYRFFGYYSFPVFLLLGNVLPLFFLALPKTKRQIRKKEQPHA